MGLGANVPADAIYRNAYKRGGDYVLEFTKTHGAPPVNAFWSVTVYDADGYFVPNDLNRHSLGSESELPQDAEGTVRIFFQHDPPASDNDRKSWLKIPDTGTFSVTARL